MTKLHLTLLLVAMALASCSRHANDYAAFSTIDPEGWNYGNTKVYIPQLEDSVAVGTLQVVVRHNNDYPYRNLWLEVSSQQERADGSIATRIDTLNIPLADAMGNWYGSGPGSTYRTGITVDENYTLIARAPVRVRHIMREESVSGIEQIGIIFNKK